ncbi:MAG: gamma-glutamyltransferase, partial [Gammaproteobacteria bacterium]|nr:gamma-glutamyltransferase [Gammaproteobacteria bacterium]
MKKKLCTVVTAACLLTTGLPLQHVLAAPKANTAIFSGDDLHHPVWAEKGMVATQEALASQIGLDILKKGGNAVDASVAIGFALAVTLPRAGNIGGGG